MKEIIERAEKLGYKRWFKFWHITELSEDQFYLELCLIQKWMREKFGIMLYFNYDYDGNCIYVIRKNKSNTVTKGNWTNPLKALEEGIKKALEIL